MAVNRELVAQAEGGDESERAVLVIDSTRKPGPRTTGIVRQKAVAWQLRIGYPTDAGTAKMKILAQGGQRCRLPIAEGISRT